MQEGPAMPRKRRAAEGLAIRPPKGRLATAPGASGRSIGSPFRGARRETKPRRARRRQFPGGFGVAENRATLKQRRHPEALGAAAPSLGNGDRNGPSPSRLAACAGSHLRVTVVERCGHNQPFTLCKGSGALLYART